MAANAAISSLCQYKSGQERVEKYALGWRGERAAHYRNALSAHKNGTTPAERAMTATDQAFSYLSLHSSAPSACKNSVIWKVWGDPIGTSPSNPSADAIKSNARQDIAAPRAAAAKMIFRRIFV